MNDFKSYSQSGGNGGQRGNGTNGGANGGQKSSSNNNGAGYSGGNAAGGSSGGDIKQTVNMAAMLAKAFEGKSESQIFQTILAQAEQGKRDGTLTNTDLDNFYNALAPLLDGFKRQRLKAIIQKLKTI